MRYAGSLRRDSGSFADLKRDHQSLLTAPMDAYWESALIGHSDHYEIRVDDSRAGFYCLNSENQLMVFHLSSAFLPEGEAVLRHIVGEHGVQTAFAGTNDPLFLSLCLEIGTRSRVHTLLFEDHQKITPSLEGFSDLSFRRATENDFDDILRHYCGVSGEVDMDSVESGFDGMKGYIRSVLDEFAIFLLHDGSALIATSECRISRTQQPYADVGMIVAEKQRRRGVGSYMLARTKEFCYEHGAKPICSCESGNIGSKKAILRAGFVSRHRMILTQLGAD